MATVMPARNYWQIPFLEGNYWSKPGVGGPGTAFNTFEMVMSGTGDGVFEQFRCAMKFDTTTPPSWINDGDGVELNSLLFLYLGSDSSDAGTTGIRVAKVTAGAWDETSNWATMFGLALSAFSGNVTPLPPGKISGWVAIPFSFKSADYRNALGLVFQINVGSGLSCYKILKDPAPFVRAYYQYPIDDVIEPDAVERLALTDDAKADIAKSSTKFTLAASIQQSHLSAIDTDIDVILGKDSAVNVLSRELSFPETWNPQFGGRGSVKIGKDVDISDHGGDLFSISLTERNAQKPAVEIGKSAVIIGEIHESDTNYEVTLEDPIIETLKRVPYYKDTIAGMQGVNVLDEHPLWALTSIFVNGAGIPWERFRQADIVWLLRRFGTTWSDITKALSTATIGSLIKEWGGMYAIAIGRGNDDAILIFHPSVYRPSLEVWDFDLDNAVDIDLIDRERNKQYDTVKVNDYEVTFPGTRPTKYDRIDSDYSITGLTGDFSHDEAKAGLGLHLAMRMCGSYRLLTFTADKEALLWEVGDQVRITSASRNLDVVPFLVIGNKSTPIKGKCQITAVHYPDNPAIHSTFENTGIQGIWRWINWYSGSGTGVNQAWEGSAGSWTGGGAITGHSLFIDWQGAICDLSETITGANFAPEDTADLCDLVDFDLGLYGDQTTSPYTIGRDPEYNQILSFRNGNEAVIVGIHRVDTSGGGGIQPKAVENTLFLGYTTDYTLSTIVWSQIIETSPGISFGSGWLIYGIAVQWKNSDCRLYVNREYIGTVNISKTGFDSGTRAIETQVHTEQLIGLMRWLQRTDGEWFETNRLLGKNGTDPYYP